MQIYKDSKYLKNRILISVILLAMLLAAVLPGCGDFALTKITNQPENSLTTPVKSDIPSTSGVSNGAIRVKDLPAEARKTMLLIESGGPFPYSKDGAVFNNFEGLLPKKP